MELCFYDTSTFTKTKQPPAPRMGSDKGLSYSQKNWKSVNIAVNLHWKSVIYYLFFL